LKFIKYEKFYDLISKEELQDPIDNFYYRPKIINGIEIPYANSICRVCVLGKKSQNKRNILGSKTLNHQKFRHDEKFILKAHQTKNYFVLILFKYDCELGFPKKVDQKVVCLFRSVVKKRQSYIPKMR